MVVGAVLVVLDPGVIMTRHIDLASDDGFDLVLLGLLVAVLVGELEELLDSVHVAVVGDRQGGHAHLLGPVEQGCY